MNTLKDNFFRPIDYLRLSVTDRCNLRCIYCMPSGGVLPSKYSEILKYEEIIRIVEIAAGLGVGKVRLTGGEPLRRKNIAFLISSIKKIAGIDDLSMTTNGILLEKYSEEIAAAGLDRINVSIDSIDADRYGEITRGGDLATVLRGVDAAKKAGLHPVKINMVPMRGINDDEILDFARLTMNTDYHVRFIEFMPSGSVDLWNPERYITTDEVKRVIETIAPLSPVRIRTNGPSRYFRLEGAVGVIGFISALTHHFCEDCNRIRLTADGKLKPCLFSETEIDLRSPIRSGAPDSELERLIRLSVKVKPGGHTIGEQGPYSSVNRGNHDVRRRNNTDAAGKADIAALLSDRRRPMSKIGG